MNRILLSVILVLAPLIQARGQVQQQMLLSAQGASAVGIALISHGVYQSVTGNQFVTTAQNTSGATLLVFGVVSGVGSVSTVTASSPSQSLTALGIYGNGSGGRYVSLYYVCGSSVGGSAQTFTTSTLTAANPSYEVWAFSGTATSGCLDTSGTPSAGYNGSAQTSNNTTIQPGSITPSQTAGELFVTLLFAGGGTGTANSINDSFTLDDAAAGTANATGIGAGHYVAPSNSALNPTWTASALWPLAATMAVFLHQ
jgi:hypothetical protein